MKSKVDDSLVRTKNELQLLKTTTDFKVKKACGGLLWKGQIDTDPKHICFKFLQKVAENIFSILRVFFTKDRIATKIKQLRYKYSNALDLGKQSEAGRIVAAFYDTCNEIWREWLATE